MYFTSFLKLLAYFESFNIHKSINIIHHINKSQKPHGHLNRCRKSIGQNPTSVYYKNSATKVGIGGTYLNIIKAIYDKPTANIIVSGKKAENLPTKICNKTRMPTLNTFIQHCIGSLSHRNTHIYVCVCVYLFHIVYTQRLNIVPCAIQ